MCYCRYVDPVMATGWHMLLGGLPLASLSLAKEGSELGPRLQQLTGQQLTYVKQTQHSAQPSLAHYAVDWLSQQLCTSIFMSHVQSPHRDACVLCDLCNPFCHVKSMTPVGLTLHVCLGPGAVALATDTVCWCQH